MKSKEFQSLYKLAKAGKISKWSVSVHVEDDVPVIVRISGFIGFKERTNRRFIKKGVNIGKSNEKSAWDNAVFIANNYWKDHIEDNYVEDIEDIHKEPKFLYPMLAKPYKECDVWPKYVQRKYNGVRCLSFRHKNDPRMISRKRKEFPALTHIKNSVDEIFGANSPDGEIYNHHLSFQEIVRRTKKYRAGLTEELQYHVYDLAIPNMGFLDRYDLLKKLVGDHHTVKVAELYPVYTHDGIKTYHDQFVDEGFEGVIVRYPDEEYGFNDRPKHLQKFKEFLDEEFEVVDHYAEEWDDNGTIRNLVMWVCVTEEGRRFNVRPKGSFERRIRWYDNAKFYYGKQLTVRYQERSEDNVPIFGIGIEFRDYE